MQLKKRVFIALSGGVDSSVAAALLVNEGHTVEATYLKYASEVVSHSIDTTSCAWEEDLRFARATTDALNIPLHVLNVEREYDDRIISRFVQEYDQGRTPNPDVLCNREIKFKFFSKWAHERGADLIATGHYARIGSRHGKSILLSGVDTAKDQSYFLYAIDKHLLSRIVFPIGHMTKTEVRRYAIEHNLATALRPDSQGVCFIGNFRVRDFLRSKLMAEPGPVATASGTVIGRHEGLKFYTIGQRHGLGLGGGTPLYVAEKKHATQTLVVAQGEHDPILYKRSCTTEKPNWLTDGPVTTIQCKARIRYRQPLTDAYVINNGDSCMVHFMRPQRAVTPGQSIVFYSDDQVLGGAVIDSVH